MNSSKKNENKDGWISLVKHDWNPSLLPNLSLDMDKIDAQLEEIKEREKLESKRFLSLSDQERKNFLKQLENEEREARREIAESDLGHLRYRLRYIERSLELYNKLIKN